MYDFKSFLLSLFSCLPTLLEVAGNESGIQGTGTAREKASSGTGSWTSAGLNAETVPSSLELSTLFLAILHGLQDLISPTRD